LIEVGECYLPQSYDTIEIALRIFEGSSLIICRPLEKTGWEIGYENSFER